MPLRGRTALALLATGIAAWSLGCGDDPTSISLHTTASVPCSGLKGVSFTVTVPGALDGPTTTTTQCTDDVPEARIGTLVLLPGTATDAKISIRVVAGVDRPVGECVATNAYAGCIIARRTVRFVPKREIDLAIALRAECKNIGCDGASTCVRGECRSAKVDDPDACASAACDESALEPRPASTTPTPDGGTPTVVVLPDGGTVTTLPDGGLVCGASEKICAGVCVSAADAKFGCGHLGCSPCAGSDVGDYTCVNDACVLLQCKAGLKTCAGACVPADVAHGCAAPTCGACDGNNGVASCQSGACAIACAAGYKPCGGKCVSVDDPTFGCGPTSCDSSSCPPPGSGGALTCRSGSCVIGECPAGTKNCNQKCVPTDVNNGCQDPARCTACGPSEQCQGAPTACTCVPQADSVTCQGRSCGAATNNCGQTVNCPDLCTAPNVCNGGGAGPNGCGCNANSTAVTCSGLACGTATNNCGQGVLCPDTCVAPNVCGGAGNPNGCGCTSTFSCGQVGCGAYYDNCGTYFDCGSCGGGD